jgi:hypothetical protein
MNLKIFMQIGSWDDKMRLTGALFSVRLFTEKAFESLTSALANHMQQNNFDGLLISWYYPGCLRVRFSLQSIVCYQLLYCCHF